MQNIKTIQISQPITNFQNKSTLPPLSIAAKEAKIKISAIFSEYNLAFQIPDHMTEVLKSVFTDKVIAKKITLNRIRCTNIVKQMIAKVETEETVSNLKNANFSTLVDESTDFCDIKFMCTLV